VQVAVKPYLFLRDMFGVKSLTIDLPEGATVKELLQTLRRDHQMPEKLAVAGTAINLVDRDGRGDLIVLVNGRNIKQLQGLDSPLNEGDTISLLPPAAGG